MRDRYVTDMDHLFDGAHYGPPSPRDAMNRSTTISGRLERGVIRDAYQLEPLWTSDLEGIERLHVKAGSMLYGSGSDGQIFGLQLNANDQESELR